MEYIEGQVVGSVTITRNLLAEGGAYLASMHNATEVSLYEAIQGYPGLPRCAQGCPGVPRAAQVCLGLPRATQVCSGLPRATQGCPGLPRCAQGIYYFFLVKYRKVVSPHLI